MADWIKDVINVSHVYLSVDTQLVCKGTIPDNLFDMFAVVIDITKYLDMGDINVPNDVWQSLQDYHSQKDSTNCWISSMFISTPEAHIPKTSEDKCSNDWLVTVNDTEVFLSARRLNLLVSLTRTCGTKLNISTLKYLENDKIQNNGKYKTNISFFDAGNTTTCHIRLGQQTEIIEIKTTDEYRELCNRVR